MAHNLRNYRTLATQARIASVRQHIENRCFHAMDWLQAGFFSIGSGVAHKRGFSTHSSINTQHQIRNIPINLTTVMYARQTSMLQIKQIKKNFFICFFFVSHIPQLGLATNSKCEMGNFFSDCSGASEKGRVVFTQRADFYYHNIFEIRRKYQPTIFYKRWKIAFSDSNLREVT